MALWPCDRRVAELQGDADIMGVRELASRFDVARRYRTLFVPGDRVLGHHVALHGDVYLVAVAPNARAHVAGFIDHSDDHRTSARARECTHTVSRAREPH